jgi:hypothetical protein
MPPRIVAIPAKYARPDTTPLTLLVQREGQPPFAINLSD